jgi:OmpA-OmpF porin, OOP family
MPRTLVLVSVALLLGASAAAQAPDDDFNTFPPAPGTAAPAAPPATAPARPAPAQQTPPVQPPAQQLPPLDTPTPVPVTAPSQRTPNPPAPVYAPAAVVPSAGTGPTPLSEGPVAGETVVRILPGSPPPGPSTLGNDFVDVRNSRLSQGLFGGLAAGLNVSSADIGSAGVLRFGAFGQYYNNTGWPRPTDEATRTAGLFALDFVVLDWLELYASYAASSTSNTGSNPHFISAVGDVGLGAKASWRLSKTVALALDVRASRFPGVGTQDIAQAGYTLAPYLLFAWSPPIPLHLSVQFGAQFQWNSVALTSGAEDDIALDRTTYNQLLGGISLEFPIPIVTPFFEYTTGFPLNVKGDTLIGTSGSALPIHAALPHQINVGLKFSLVENLTFILVGQFGLQGNVALGVPAIPPWNFVFAATYAVDLFPKPATRVVVQQVPTPVAPPPPSTGTVVGMVTDATTQKPLGNVVVTAEAGEMGPVASDVASGQFVTRPLKPGPVKFRLQKDGYQEILLDTAVEAGKATQVQAALTPVVKTSRFLVTTSARKKPVAATVKFSGAETKAVETKADVAEPLAVPAVPGAYTVEVTAPGYLAQVREVEVSAGAELQLAFELQLEPKKKRVLFRDDRLELLVQVHFAPGKATILADSYPLLDEVVDAVVRFGIKRVRVEGYTDSSGSRSANLRLSQTRAEAVTEYLEKKGLSPKRLEAKGYGDARPIAPNLTARGRELNRRVEIVVLEK